MNRFTLFATAAAICSTSSMHAITPEEGRAIRAAFEDSLLAIRESGELAQPPSGQASFVMPAEQEKRMIALIEKGLSLSKKVTDHFLDWVHPQLKSQYRDNLIKGTQTYYDGLKAKDPKKQADGIQLQVKWIEWWEANATAVDNKLNRNK